MEDSCVYFPLLSAMAIGKALFTVEAKYFLSSSSFLTSLPPFDVLMCKTPLTSEAAVLGCGKQKKP